MKILEMEQHSQEWLDWRNGGVGSSDAIVIAAHYGLIETTAWMDSLDALFNEKMTGISRTVENDRMRRGTAYEDEARKAFEAAHGCVVQPLCAEMDDEPRIRASFDGISFDHAMINEIKVPHEKVVALAKAGEVIEYYLPQLAHQAIVAWGDPAGWDDEKVITFYAYDPVTASGETVRLSALDIQDFAQKLYGFEMKFLLMLDRKEPPCGFPFFHAAQRYADLDSQIKELTLKRDAEKDALIELAQKQELEAVEGGGVRVSKAKRSGTVNWKKLTAEYDISGEEQEKYRGKGSSYWRAIVQSSASVKAGEPLAGTKAAKGEREDAFVEDPCWGALMEDPA